MLAVWCAFRAEGRRRLLSWFAIACLAAVVGSTVLAGASAARRTETALPDYLARYGADAEFYSTTARLPAALGHLHYAKVSVTTRLYLNANASIDGQVVPGDFLSMFSLPPDATSHFVKLVSGRLPTAADEVDVGYAMQQQYHLHAGSIVVMPLYALSQRRQVFESPGTPPAHGVTMHFHVVGVTAAAFDYLFSQPSYSIYVGRAFDDTIGRHAVSATLGMVRLSKGAAQLPQLTYDVNHFAVPGGFAGVQPLDDEISAAEDSIHPQAIGWWLFALLALLAGLALVGQALSRQSIVERESYPSLSALGVRPGQLLGIGLARAGVIGVAGALGAVVIATALSPLTPVGEASIAEPRHGIVFDPVVFGFGGLAVIVTVLLLGLLPAWRAAQVQRLRQREERSIGHGASRVASVLSRTGAGPSVLVGVRHALERGKGRSSVPVASALVGTVAAVGALVAASVFGASLSSLVSTPRLYGQDFQFVATGVSAPFVKSLAASLEDNPAVTSVTGALIGKYITVNGVSVAANIAVPYKGPMIFSLVDGRDPEGPHEIALGTQTMRDAGLHVGSTAHVTIITPNGKPESGGFLVVGSVAFPPAISTGGLGVGSVVPIPAAYALACPPGPSESQCHAVVHHQLYQTGSTNWGVAVRVTPNAAGRHEVTRLLRTYPQYAQILSLPTNLVNFGQAVNFPALLGVTLAVFGAATLAHLLLVSASRRRREFALLKVLGFVQRQVRSSVGWQATTVASVGIVFGVPIGLALGNLAWHAFASNLGVVPLTVMPIALIVLVCAGVVVLGNVLAVAPAAVAARSRAASALREE